MIHRICVVVAVALVLYAAPRCLAAGPDQDGGSLHVTISTAQSIARQYTDVARRDPVFTSLSTSYAALQLWDLQSTASAIDRGGREANPIMSPIVGNGVAFAMAKIGATVLTINVLERLRRNHPRAAMMTMIGLNAMYAGVVANNYRVDVRRSH